MVTSRVPFHWMYSSDPSDGPLVCLLSVAGESNTGLPESATGAVLQPVQVVEEGCAGVEVIDT